MSISKQELLQKREEIMKQRDENAKEIKERSDKFKCTRYFEGYGMSETMAKDDLIGATEELFKMTNVETRNAVCEELGFEPVDSDSITVYGYTKTEWLADFKNRAAVIKLSVENRKLNKALEIIERNLSEDDKFNLDMQKVEELI